MNLRKLAHAYLDAQANENAAFQAIEGAGTDAQWDAYFDAQDDSCEARDRMLTETRKITLSMIKCDNDRNNVTAFFDLAIRREGDARAKAIMKAFELAALTGA